MKINSLIEKAFDSAIPYTWDSLDYHEVEKVMNVFAELLVQECASVADHSVVTGKSIIGQRIKQHFGVEA